MSGFRSSLSPNTKDLAKRQRKEEKSRETLEQEIDELLRPVLSTDKYVRVVFEDVSTRSLTFKISYFTYARGVEYVLEVRQLELDDGAELVLSQIFVKERPKITHSVPRTVTFTSLTKIVISKAIMNPDLSIGLLKFDFNKAKIAQNIGTLRILAGLQDQKTMRKTVDEVIWATNNIEHLSNVGPLTKKFTSVVPFTVQWDNENEDLDVQFSLFAFDVPFDTLKIAGNRLKMNVEMLKKFFEKVQTIQIDSKPTVSWVMQAVETMSTISHTSRSFHLTVTTPAELEEFTEAVQAKGFAGNINGFFKSYDNLTEEPSQEIRFLSNNSYVKISTFL